MAISLGGCGDDVPNGYNWNIKYNKKEKTISIYH